MLTSHTQPMQGHGAWQPARPFSGRSPAATWETPAPGGQWDVTLFSMLLADVVAVFQRHARERHAQERGSQGRRGRLTGKGEKERGFMRGRENKKGKSKGREKARGREREGGKERTTERAIERTTGRRREREPRAPKTFWAGLSGHVPVVQRGACAWKPPAGARCISFSCCICILSASASASRYLCVCIETRRPKTRRWGRK